MSTVKKIEPPREPSEYSPDLHACEKAKKRNIEGWLFDHLIKNGKVERKGRKRFVFYDYLKTYDPETEEYRTDKWVLPVQVKLSWDKNIVVTSPYIQGLKNDRKLAELNPNRP